ncbi:group II intron maturase-specific domain-containing protein [Bradyrhizobium hipponense]|uniref:group II intron maturase-specific domain-containing protein n=1 Tax=Bradyrhizobium hipponense TaxID=2605638 RepID=UPI003221E85F
MTTGEVIILNRNSTFWATCSGPVGRRTVGESTSSTSAPVSAMPRRRQSDRKSVPGNYAAGIRGSTIWRGCSTGGWMNYYGWYYKSALYPTLRHLDRCLARWAMSKYKRPRRHRRRAEYWVREIAWRPPRCWPLADAAQDGGWTVRAG